MCFGSSELFCLSSWKSLWVHHCLPISGLTWGIVHLATALWGVFLRSPALLCCFPMFAAWIPNVYQPSVPPAKQVVIQAGCAGWGFAGGGQGKMLRGGFCCSGLFEQQEVWEVQVWIESQTEGSFIWKNIFILHLYRIFAILISPDFYRSTHCLNLICFARWSKIYFRFANVFKNVKLSFACLINVHCGSICLLFC